MSISAPNRTCGRCGAPVSDTDETCPNCGALLAAYRPPRGSEAGITITAAPKPVPPLRVLVDQDIPASRGTRKRTTVTRPDPATTAVPPPAMRSTNADARPDTSPKVLASSRKKAQPILPRTDPRDQVAPQLMNPPSRRRPASRHQESMREAAPATGPLRRLALVVLVMIAVLGVMDFDLVPIVVVGVVLTAVLGTMRTAARASGRKTTTMHDPKGPGRRR
jgi:hypothetical protein